MHFYYVRGCNFRSWIKIGDIYQATNDITCVVRDETGMFYEFQMLAGFRTNGGSVPWFAQWYVPSWSSTNDLINIAYSLHDGIYASGIMHRDLADDLLRGLARDSGYSRTKAGLICWAVNQFGASHYGKDELDTAKFLKLHVYNP